MADRLAELYMPQVEQFGIKLQPSGAALVGSVDNERAAARVVVYRLGPACVVTSHRIQVWADMPFHESGMPGLCVCTLSADSLAMCPVAPPRAPARAGNVAIFGHETCGRPSTLRAGQVHDATSITFLPDWFGHLDAATRKLAYELIEEPGSSCQGDEAAVLDRGMCAMTPLFGGALLSERGLAQRAEAISRGALAWFAARTQAEREAGTRAQARLVRSAACFVAQHLGDAFTLDDLARELLSSRTRLCAAFQQEMGESLGCYIRRMRMERARYLLERGGRSVAEVAREVGYPRVSSFTVAFERAYGIPPRALARNAASGVVPHAAAGNRA